MPTSKQRREAAQRHLQRQLQRRAEQARRRRRNALISGAVLAVILVVGAIVLATGVGRHGGTAASASGTATSSAAADGSNGTCAFTKDTTGTTAKDVGTPPTQVPTSGTTQLTMTTNFGPIGITLDQAQAPCAAASFAYLASKQYFDNTPCHRETDSEGLKVLQCGDPSGTGTGGPGYQFKTHTTGKETYKRGVVAMANSGQGYDGSQFFLVYGDSQLQPDYTVVGTIDDTGLSVLDAIAKNGNNGANGQGDGAPTKPVTIQTMTVSGTSGSTAAATSAPASSAPATSSAAPTS